jgi:Big-like domain-containing protein/flagellar hook capping protein FlgD/parallel beta helix pectate lyase-like protein
MKLKKLIPIFFIILSLPTLLLSQQMSEIIISGVVIDSVSSLPLPDVMVEVINETDTTERATTITESNGSYTINLEITRILPTLFSLNQNYPNPFNPTTIIGFQLPKASDVQLVIYNILGQKIKSIVNLKLEAGIYSAIWDGTNDIGCGVSAGIYFYQLQSDHFRKTKKMVLLDGSHGELSNIFSSSLQRRDISRNSDKSNNLQVTISATSPLIRTFEQNHVIITSQIFNFNIEPFLLSHIFNKDLIIVSEPGTTDIVYISGLAGAIFDTINGSENVIVINQRIRSVDSVKVDKNNGFSLLEVDAIVGDKLFISLLDNGILKGNPIEKTVPDTMPPVIIESKPTNGDKDIPIDCIITINFSEPFDSSTVDTKSFTLKDSIGIIVPGVIGFNTNYTIAYLDPIDLLSPDVQYTITVTTDVTDLQGIPLDSTYTKMFTTAKSGRVINVPADVDSIQGGINMATDGDTVLVQPGTYLENINFNGKNIVVGSLTLTTGDTSFISQTVIDGNQSGRVISFENGEDSTAILCGFTITNGEGGIIINNSNPSMSYLYINNNTSGPPGGGILCQNSGFNLSNATIANNSGNDGGGIGASNSFFNLSNVNILNNSAHSDDGGGIGCESCDFNLSNVIISNNTAVDNGGGIELLHGGNVILNNLTIANNSARSGGGIWFDGDSCNLSNVIIYDNYSNDNGGGIYFTENVAHFNFNSDNRCSIYLNQTSQLGNDLYSANDSIISVIVDTFTVFIPDSSHAYPLNKFTFDILNEIGGPVNSGSVINVPADVPTIQGGINLAVIGDTILVQPGIYVENINFNGKNIVVGSLTLTTGDTSYITQTIISADTNLAPDRGRVVTFENGEDSTAILCGFTITNGEGGIFVDNSSPSISNLLIIKNDEKPGDNYGGGIFCNNGTLILNSSNISNNSAHSGGGIEGINSNIKISNVIIKNNEVWDDGGGLAMLNCPIVQLNNLNISNNIASSEGGGIESIGSTFNLTKVTIANNSAQEGGGIYSRYGNNFIFNEVNRCNIYLNYANIGKDLYNQEDITLRVVVDTFTVLNPDSTHAYPLNKFTFDILNEIGTPVNNGTIINIPGDVSTIQGGINLAIDGDTILVQPGTYVENINFNGKNIVVGSLTLTTGDTSYISKTVIDGNQNGSVVTFENGENSNTILSGFTITNGSGRWSGSQAEGGGIFLVNNSCPNLLNLNVTGNIAPSANGAGICCWNNSNCRIENVRVTGNDGSGNASTNDGCGGILVDNSSPIIRKVEITNNIGLMAGGLFVQGSSNPILINTTIAGNIASGSPCSIKQLRWFVGVFTVIQY